jgi:hypothetical protein
LLLISSKTSVIAWRKCTRPQAKSLLFVQKLGITLMSLFFSE